APARPSAPWPTPWPRPPRSPRRSSPPPASRPPACPRSARPCATSTRSPSRTWPPCASPSRPPTTSSSSALAWPSSEPPGPPAVDKDKLIQRLMATFLDELHEHVASLNRDLLALEQGPDAGRRAALLQALFRTAHSLKGAARSVNVAPVEK